MSECRQGGAVVMLDGFIEIRLPKCRLLLTEAELTGLLATRPDLWAEAIRRGKVAVRRRRWDRRAESGRAREEERPCS